MLKVDDPVGAVGVHGLNGLFGTLAVGLFSDGTGTEWKGLFTGGGFHLLGIQILGIICVVAWVAVTMTIVFQVLKHTIGLRVPAEEEIAGLDIVEHGIASSYAGFSVHDNIGPVPAPMTGSAKVVIVTRQNKLEEFMHAMNTIGVTGVTVTNVLGCGVQKGASAYYRGVEMDMSLLPKVKIEIVVSAVPVQTVIDTAKAVLHTGQIGDGKLFVYDIENVVKIRTGEEGFDALQDTQ